MLTIVKFMTLISTTTSTITEHKSGSPKSTNKIEFNFKAPECGATTTHPLDLDKILTQSRIYYYFNHSSDQLDKNAQIGCINLNLTSISETILNECTESLYRYILTTEYLDSVVCLSYINIHRQNNYSNKNLDDQIYIHFKKAVTQEQINALMIIINTKLSKHHVVQQNIINAHEDRKFTTLGTTILNQKNTVNDIFYKIIQTPTIPIIHNTENMRRLISSFPNLHDHLSKTAYDFLQTNSKIDDTHDASSRVLFILIPANLSHQFNSSVIELYKTLNKSEKENLLNFIIQISNPKQNSCPNIQHNNRHHSMHTSPQPRENQSITKFNTLP